MHNDPAHNGRGDYELINGEYFKTSNPGNRSYVRVPVDALVIQPVTPSNGSTTLPQFHHYHYKILLQYVLNGFFH